MHATRTPLEIELLISADARRPSAIEKVIDFRKSIESPDPRFDEIDAAMADPIHDHRPQTAPQRKVRSVLDILDQLDRENSTRRFNH